MKENAVLKTPHFLFGANKVPLRLMLKPRSKNCIDRAAGDTVFGSGFYISIVLS